MRSIRSLSLAFAAGAFGGLLNAFTVWGCGRAGLTAALGIKMAPPLTPEFLYEKIVWGGVWGFVFLIPLIKNIPLLRGILFSLFPTLVQLFVIFPYQLNKGMMGLDLGTLTPAFVVFFNLIWGIAAAVWFNLVKDRPTLLERMRA
jgi:hypothetical protein